MPRSGSRGSGRSSGSGLFHSSVPARRAPAPPAPAPQRLEVSGPTLGQSVKDGFGLGVGSSLGHRAVSWMFGPPAVGVATPTAGGPAAAPADPCQTQKGEMDACFKSWDSDRFEQVRIYKACVNMGK